MESIFGVTNAEENKLPSINSNDPNERKLARRMRIQARLEAEKEEAGNGEANQDEEPEKSLINQAIDDSEDTLRQLYDEGKYLVTNIMVASDAKEVARREVAEEERNNRLEQLKEDSSAAMQKLNEISSKWEAIMNLNGPLELFEHMKEQKAKCLELIQQKNDLIKSFQMELKLADEKFMKGWKAMYEELSLLTRRIDEQVLIMKKAYRIELANIEEAVDVSRTELMEKNQKTWVALYNQRENTETSNMSRNFVLVDNFYEELHNLHVDHDEKYRELRIQLETDIQMLEQELEQVKALCLLNSEKLDYNYQVLKKREEENVYIKNHQKRRLNKLQDLVNTLKKKIDDKRQSTDEEYKKLTRDVTRYYKNILDTEKKAELFSEVNDEKFNDIWKMKDEEAKDLLQKIFSADMVIYEQILGLEWKPLTFNFDKMDLLSYRTAVDVAKEIKRRTRRTKSSHHFRSTNKELIENNTEPEVLEGHKRLLSHILELLADQSGFLMEEKLDELLQPYTGEEKTFVRLDNVFVAIGIRTKDDLDLMKKVFFPYTVCLLCEKERKNLPTFDFLTESRRSTYCRHQSILQMRELEEKVSKLRIQAKANEEDDSSLKANDFESTRSESSKTTEKASLRNSTANSTMGSSRATTITESKTKEPLRNSQTYFLKCNITHPLVIEKIFVLRALKDFVSLYHSHRIPLLTGIEEKLVQKRITVSRLLSKDDIISYWERFKYAIPQEREVIWRGVYEGLTRYLAILKERHELNVKAQALRRQNLELKRLLRRHKFPDTCETFKLPVRPSLPSRPIEYQEILNISKKLSF